MRRDIDRMFSDSRAERREQMADISMRLERVDNHLERLNSKVATHEVRIAEEAQKTKSMAEHVFGRRKHDAAGDEAPVITWGNIRRASMGLGLIAVALEVLRYTGDAAVALVRAVVRHP